MQGVHAYEDFYASHDHMPGSDRTLRVTGTVVFRTGGWSACLQPTEGNTAINPQMLSLNLVITPPDEGAVTTDALTPVDVQWSVDDPQTEYEQVQFRVLGSPDDDPPPVIDVVHPE